ncbi:MAG: hypothetical protein ACFE96_01025 [Candidatus Hermodarchaeota archaeon]
MKSIFNPNTIYEKILRNDITMKEGIDILISFVEKSENTRIRLDCLKILFNMKAQDSKIFKTLENCIISDENDEIRVISAKFLLVHYLHVGEDCLKWAILNDKSSTFLKSIREILDGEEVDRYEVFYEAYLQRLNNIAKKYEIVSEEVPFLIDLELNIDRIKFIDWSQNSKLFYDKDVMFLTQDQHILELSVSLRNEIPPSINLLKNLEILDLSCNNLKDLPNSLKDVTNLKILDLSWNNFNKVPDVLNELNPITTINFQNDFHKQKSK